MPPSVRSVIWRVLAPSPGSCAWIHSAISAPTSSGNGRSSSSTRVARVRAANASFICTTRSALSVTTTRSMIELNVFSSSRRWRRTSSRSLMFSMPTESCRLNSSTRAESCPASRLAACPSTTNVPSARRQPRSGAIRTWSAPPARTRGPVSRRPRAGAAVGSSVDTLVRSASSVIGGARQHELTRPALVQPDRHAARAEERVRVARQGVERRADRERGRHAGREREAQLLNPFAGRALVGQPRDLGREALWGHVGDEAVHGVCDGRILNC